MDEVPVDDDGGAALFNDDDALLGEPEEVTGTDAYLENLGQSAGG